MQQQALARLPATAWLQPLRPVPRQPKRALLAAPPQALVRALVRPVFLLLLALMQVKMQAQAQMASVRPLRAPLRCQREAL
ncbi:MAG: hypothetical protein ABIY56_09065, partial [Dokdonella sp.]